MPQFSIESFFEDLSLCFCGSGITYEGCHKGRTYKSPHEIGFDQYRYLHSKSFCGISEHGRPCNQRVISSHSIQKARSLRAISENHHVMGFSVGPNAKRNLFESGLDFVSISANRASTFPGFCPRHDTKFFSYTENGALKASFKTAIALAIRSQIYEATVCSRNAVFLEWIHQKASFQFPFDLGASDRERENLLFYAGYSWELTKRLLKRQAGKSVFPFFFVCAKLNCTLPFTTTASFCIETDFNGERLQKFSEIGGKFNFAQISILPDSDGTSFFCLSALGDRNKIAANGLVKSILNQSKAEWVNCMLRLAITHSENTYFSPSFIAALSGEQKQELLDRFDDSTVAMVGLEKPKDALSKKLSFSLKANVLEHFSHHQ